MFLREKDIALDDIADRRPDSRPASLVRRLTAAVLLRAAQLFVETALIRVGARRREVRNVPRRPYLTLPIRQYVRVPSVNLRVEIVVVRLRLRMPCVEECGKVGRNLFV
ncbi:hypothetical protein [Paenibacillus sp. YIM B09110]|uniref:hypothetical protein n=1 Tax=Paenibacillus sp. YIM B09110 TaxID=3126102 RepID=UPI00301C1DC4